jgi:hypothetical protein
MEPILFSKHLSDLFQSEQPVTGSGYSASAECAVIQTHSLKLLYQKTDLYGSTRSHVAAEVVVTAKIHVYCHFLVSRREVLIDNFIYPKLKIVKYE